MVDSRAVSWRNVPITRINFSGPATAATDYQTPLRMAVDTFYNTNNNSDPRQERRERREVAADTVSNTNNNSNSFNLFDFNLTNNSHTTDGSSSGGKRVRWCEELEQVRDITPRVREQPFRFPVSHPAPAPVRHYAPSYAPVTNQTSSDPTNRCRHFTCPAGRPCLLASPGPGRGGRAASPRRTARLPCSPQLKQVVARARPDLSLAIPPALPRTRITNV